MITDNTSNMRKAFATDFPLTEGPGDDDDVNSDNDTDNNNGNTDDDMLWCDNVDTIEAVQQFSSQQHLRCFTHTLQVKC